MESKAAGARVLDKFIDLLYSFESHRPPAVPFSDQSQSAITLTPFRLQAKGRSKLVAAVKRFAEMSRKLGSDSGGDASALPAARVGGGSKRLRP